MSFHTVFFNIEVFYSCTVFYKLFFPLEIKMWIVVIIGLVLSLLSTITTVSCFLW